MFCYFRKSIMEHSKIKSTTGKAKAAFSVMKKIGTNKRMYLITRKKERYYSPVWSVFLYVYKIWTTTDKNQSKLSRKDNKNY